MTHDEMVALAKRLVDGEDEGSETKVKDELWGIGRGYLLLILSLAMAFTLCLKTIITGDAFLTFAGVVLSTVVGFKEYAKISIAKTQSKEGETNGSNV